MTTPAGFIMREGVAYEQTTGAMLVTLGSGAAAGQAAAAALGLPFILSQSAIPFIHLSSGSVSAVGAISAITALPLAYPAAYCWFPANALATSIAAGWYYCTFSTTTAGTAFLNTYTSGQPVIPSSPTAVTDGKGSFTSDVSSHVGPTISVPANSLGINGRLRIQLEAAYTSSAGTKTVNVAYGASSTTAFSVATTSLYSNTETVFTNRGTASNQNINGYGVNGASGVINAAPTLGTLDTTTALNVTITLAKNTATDNLVLDRYGIELMYSA